MLIKGKEDTVNSGSVYRLNPLVDAKNNANYQLYQQWLQQQQQQQVQTVQNTQANSFDLQSFVNNNKLLVFGVVAIGLYFVFGGSLGASERTVTSITRYGKK